MGVNQFTILTDKEFKARFLYLHEESKVEDIKVP